MKKFTVMLMVFVLSLMVSSGAMAGGVREEVKQATMTIEKVYYAKDSGYYMAHTSKDQDGCFWVLQVTDIVSAKEDKSFTYVLSKQYQDKQVIVTYVESTDTDDEVEIWSVKLK
nr:hypothetical protein [Paenibacillus xylanexedens]